MNIEENRLHSFNSWPTNAPIDPERLARAGFYATGNTLETECHWCHKKISDWQYGDQIMARHRRLCPLCMFIINPTESGNVPLINSSSTAAVNEPNNVSSSESVSIEQIDVKNEMHRLSTFTNWPNPNISPQSLAKAGFYYLNQSDQVKCAWCKGVIAKWEKNDNAFEEHQRFFPDCPRVQLGPFLEIASDGIRDLGIQQISPPKKAKYSSLDARMRTYANWPISDVQKPEALAQAGFYYQDIDDQVRCFHCNGGLRSWQKEDDPWFDHAKWFPHCQFVKLVMSPQYVTQVQELARQNSQNTIEPVDRPGPVSSIQAMTFDEAMCSRPVLVAISMGLDAGRIRKATKMQMDKFGRPYETSEELVQAVLDEQGDEQVDEIDEFARRSNMSSEEKLTYWLHSLFPEDVPDPRPRSTNQSASLPGPSKWVEGTVPKPTITEPNNEKNLSLEEENRKLKDARLCKVCMDEDVGIVFLPCGHLVTCVQCAPGVNQCPLCRTTIKGFVRTFMS